MRTTKTVSISMPPAQLREAERLAKRENRTMSELFREAFRRYQDQEGVRRKQLEKLGALLDASRMEAEQNGTAGLSEQEIDAEIKAYRTERRQKAR